MVGLAVLLGIGIVAAHDKAVAGETRLLNDYYIQIGP